MAIEQGPQFGDFLSAGGMTPEQQQEAEFNANQDAFIHHHENFHRNLAAAHSLHAIVQLTGDQDAADKRDEHLIQSRVHAEQCEKLNDGDPIMVDDPEDENFGECLHCGRSLLR